MRFSCASARIAASSSLRQITAVGIALCQQFVRDLGVTRCAGELEHRLAVPVEIEPLHSVEDCVDRGIGRAGRGRYLRYAAGTCRRDGAQRAS
jgi:hypothetical protein